MEAFDNLHLFQTEKHTEARTTKKNNHCSFIDRYKTVTDLEIGSFFFKIMNKK